MANYIILYDVSCYVLLSHAILCAVMLSCNTQIGITCNIIIQVCHTGACEKNHSSGEEDTWGTSACKSTKSGAGEQFLLLGCTAKARAKGVFLFTDTGMSVWRATMTPTREQSCSTELLLFMCCYVFLCSMQYIVYCIWCMYYLFFRQPFNTP